MTSAHSRVHDDRLNQHIRAGNARAQESDWTGAAKSFLNAIEVDENSAAAYNNLGYVLQLNQHSDDAIAMYLRALSLDPHYEVARNNLLDELLHRVNQSRGVGNPAETRRLIALGIAALGPCRELLLARGDACMDDGSLDEAIASYAAILQGDRQDMDAWARLGDVCEVAGDARRASGAYLSAAQQLPPEASECTDEGIAALQAGRYDVAILWFRRALGRDPGYELAVPYLEWAQAARLGRREAVLAS